MVISEELAGHVLVLRLAGRLDEGTASDLLSHLQTRLGEQPTTDVLFDFTHVFYVNHHGLATILTIAQKLRSASRRLSIAGVQDSVFPVLEMNGLAGLILLVPDVGEGLIQLARHRDTMSPTLDVQAP